MLHLYTFGGLRIEQEEQILRLPTRKADKLLAYLVTYADRSHPRTTLIGVFWPDLPEAKARRRLSDTLWRVRHVLGDHVVANEEEIWLNDALPRWVDVEQFRAALAHLQHEAPESAAVEKALSLYRGPYLEGLYDDWALLERERWRGLYLDALGYLVEQYKRVGDYRNALRAARRLIAVEPLHEVAHRELMRLYHLLGRDAEAVVQYQRCRDLLREALDVSPAPETEMLYRVLQRRGTPAAMTSLSHLPAPARSALPDLNAPPLVGRDAERAALLGHLERAAQGRGALLLLEGEPGIGKSRLIEELIAGARWRNIEVLQAQTTTAASFAPLTAALSPALTPLRLRQLRRLLPELDLQAVLQAVAPLLPQLKETENDRITLHDLAPPDAYDRLEQALVTLILSLSRVVPCLWVLEDLQEIDGETLALLPRLYPQLVDHRVLLVLTGRCTEIRERAPVWETLQALDRQRAFPRYTLSRLEKKELHALLERLLDEVRPNLIERLMRESGGVPLYVVELLKVWRDEGRLSPTKDGCWHWAGELPAMLPRRLGREIIGHRLTRLSQKAQAVLKAAAVIGTAVDFDLLAEVSTSPTAPPDPSQTERYMQASDELLALGFLTETEVGYRFSHEQVRRAVYDQLTQGERRRLHHRVALALEEQRPDAHQVLARHFAAAGLRAPALHHLKRAAQDAREVFAHRTALKCCDQLLSLLSRPKDRADRYDVLRERAEVLGWIGDRKAQGRDLAEMLRLAEELDDASRRAAALYRRSEWHRLQGRYEAANEDARAALDLYHALGDDHARADLLSQLGRNVIYTGNYPKAAAYFEEALNLYEDLEDLDGQIGCLIGLAHVAEFEGDYVRNLHYCQQSLALAEAAGDPHRISHAFFAVGVTYHDLGDMESAQTHFRRALALAETTGDRRRKGVSHLYLGIVAIEQEAFGAARHHVETARELLHAAQDISWEGEAQAVLGRLALLQGDPAAAKTRLETAYQRCLDLGEDNYAVIHLSHLALAELARGKREPAWQKSLNAVGELDAGLSSIEHPQRIYHNHAQVAASTRHWAAARAARTQAARIVDERAARIDDPHLRALYRTGLRVNRAIADAIAAQPPAGQLRVRLARADVPAHRRPEPEEQVEVIWTVDAGEEDAFLGKREGNVALRRHRILRLLDEAKAQGALAAVADLAGALGVSARTLRADLAALRDQGHPARTRGHRD
jgi:predicted ATPase